MTDYRELIKEAEQRAAKSHDEVIRLCKSGERVRMSIPANLERDTDLLLIETVKDVERLSAALRSVLDEQDERDRQSLGWQKSYLSATENARELLQELADSYGVRTDEITTSFLDKQRAVRALTGGETE